jgi:hypothetical protein
MIFYLITYILGENAQRRGSVKNILASLFGCYHVSRSQQRGPSNRLLKFSAVIDIGWCF